MTSDHKAMDTIPWNRLLRDIHNRQVLPIIGPGLVTVGDEGREIPFIDWLAPRFPQLLNPPANVVNPRRAAWRP